MSRENYSNEEVREMLVGFQMVYMEPNLKLVAKEIGMDYPYLIKFKNGQVELANKTLVKIVAFICEKIQ